MSLGECFSSEEVVEKSTSILLNLLDSLSKVRGVSLCSLFLEISFRRYIYPFCAIIFLSKKDSINFEIGLVNVLDETSYDHAMKSWLYLYIIGRAPQKCWEDMTSNDRII